MTEPEALKISVLAVQLFTIKPDETRAALLRKAVALRDYEATKAALERQAQTSRLLSIPDLLNDIGAEDTRDWIDKQRAARRAEYEKWAKDAQADLDAARAFCQAQPPEELARMRAAIEGRCTRHSVERWQGKATLDSAILVHLIYGAFSQAGDEGGAKERVNA
jgi:hypothetical protein